MNKSSIILIFKEYVWPRRGVIFLGLFLIFISRLASLVLPLKSKILIDEIIPDKDLDALFSFILIVSVAIVVQSASTFFLTKLLSIESNHLILKLRTKVQKKILSLPICFFDNNKSGLLVSRIMSDVYGIRNIVGTGLIQLFGGAITALVSLFLLINISLKLTLFVLFPILICGTIAFKLFGYTRSIFHKRNVIHANVTGRLTETLNGIRVIKAFNAEKQENIIFKNGVNRLFQNVKKSITANATISSLSILFLGLASVAIMAFGGIMIIHNDLTTGEFLSFTLILGFMIAPLLQLSNVGSQLTDAFAGFDRTNEIMNLTTESDNKIRTNNLSKIYGDVKFQNVSFSYEKGKEVVNEINFFAPKGSVTALVGSSGSGKSTIINLLASFITPDSGMITVDGYDISKIELSSYRSQLGVVLQDDFLFDGTIRENILFANPFSSEQELLNAVKNSYVNEFVNSFDNGLDTVIGENGVKLSGGQRQRISIARAILANPRILILDEATSSLDTESEILIQNSLTQLMNGRTTFVIAHRLSTIKKADQILVIEKGEIFEQGRHDQLIEKKGRYFELFMYQNRM